MRHLRISAGLILALAASALAIAVSAAAAPEESNVAECGKAIIGHGSADWRRKSLVAGPVGVSRHPLSMMSRGSNGLVAKMALLVESDAPVTVSVPPELRSRVFLYYGRILDNHGHPTTSFNGARGYGETEFRPCEDRPRTIWPGGIRIQGQAPVHLVVSAEGQTFQLPLGRPKIHLPTNH